MINNVVLISVVLYIYIYRWLPIYSGNSDKVVKNSGKESACQCRRDIRNPGLIPGWGTKILQPKYIIHTHTHTHIQVAVVVKNPPANAGDVRDAGSIPGSGRSPGGGHGNPLQYSCLENPMDIGTCQATVHRVIKSQTQLKQLRTHMYSYTWRKRETESSNFYFI